MTGFVLCVLALLVAQGSAGAVNNDAKPADQMFLQRQVELLELYFHIEATLKVTANLGNWRPENAVGSFKNVTALEIYKELYQYDFLLPRSVPFNIHEETHQFEAVTLYNLLVSAKDYDTFYKAAKYFRSRSNEGLFVYVLSVAIVNFPETKGIAIPPIYEIFPSHFFNGMIMNIARKVNTYGKDLVEKDPRTTMWEDNVVIKWNTTLWPFAHNIDTPISYLTYDHAFNTVYYNNHITYPFWLSEKDAAIAPKRGIWWWYMHKQLFNIYYMERLSNGLGEVSELGLGVVPEGYTSGFVYPSGIPFPVRPDNFNVDQPQFVEKIEKIQELELRIRKAIDIGYFITPTGEKISLRTPEALNVLGNVIEGNFDSPNLSYYGSLVTEWKELLGNSIMSRYQYYNGYIPLVVPSALELYETTLRDPAFYMIWKRMLNLFSLYQSYLPSYTQKDLGFPAITIQKVEVEKLVTYFENVYTNITNELYMNEFEKKTACDDVVSVLVEQPQLNHKVFSTRITVKSDAPKTVLVKFFLAPKYDSKGFEIPLEKNTENFVQIDEFSWDLTKGDCLIKRDSIENKFRGENWTSGVDMYFQAYNALHGKGQFTAKSHEFGLFPQHLTIPKGHVGGMPFLFMVYITEIKPQHLPPSYGFDFTNRPYLPEMSLGYPLDRPLKPLVVKKLTNLMIQEVQIYHKPAPEIVVPYTMY